MFYILLMSLVGLICAENRDDLPTVSNCESLSLSGCVDGFAGSLDVFFHNHHVYCGELLKKNVTGTNPVVKYAEATEDSRYILLILDPDAPYHCAIPGRSQADYIHYAAVMTAENEFLSSEMELIPYEGPNPPIGEHRYKMFLYKWEGPGGPGMRNDDTSRAHFSRKLFELDNHLTYEAYFEFRVQHEN